MTDDESILPVDYQVELLQKFGVDRLYKIIPPSDFKWVKLINRLLTKGYTEKQIDEWMAEQMAYIHIIENPALLKLVSD